MDDSRPEAFVEPASGFSFSNGITRGQEFFHEVSQTLVHGLLPRKGQPTRDAPANLQWRDIIRAEEIHPDPTVLRAGTAIRFPRFPPPCEIIFMVNHTVCHLI